MENNFFVIIFTCIVLYLLFLPIISKIKKINRDKKKVKLLEKLVEEKEKNSEK